MDRFIVARSCASVLFLILFKIQYGQIYRLTEPPPVANGENLKSNMDRFIGSIQI